jgi:hypothetical protein
LAHSWGDRHRRFARQGVGDRGSKALQAAAGVDSHSTLPLRKAAKSPLHHELADQRIAELRSHIASGGLREALIRALLYAGLDRAALETIVGIKGAASTAEITERQETWRQAYLNTPHGQPVELRHAATASAAAAHHHGHSEHTTPKPVTISPAQR